MKTISQIASGFAAGFSTKEKVPQRVEGSVVEQEKGPLEKLIEKRFSGDCLVVHKFSSEWTPEELKKAIDEFFE